MTSKARAARICLLLSAIFMPPALTFAQQAQLSRLPYIQSTTTSGGVVAWRTDAATLPLLRFGTAPDQLDTVVLPGQILIRLAPDVPAPGGALRLHSAPTSTHQYEAYIGGLDAGTLYYYAIYDADRLLAGEDSEHRFRTTPVSVSGENLRLWVLGDSGTTTAIQTAGFQAALDFAENGGEPIDAFIHLGDMAYTSGTDAQFSSHFFNSYSELMRHTVCWPTMGNHEGYTSRGAFGDGPYYDSFVLPTAGEAGGLASGTEAYYSFDIGEVHFICLDSHDLNRTPTGAMALWLKADLEATNADWIIAFWHHPPYTKGSHDSDTEGQLIQMRAYIMPILEAGGVDLVLSGHSHTYERSMLIDGAYATPTTADGVVFDDGDGDPAGHGAYIKSAGLTPHGGTIAVVSGHAIKGWRRSFHPLMRYTTIEPGSTFIDIEGDVLTGTMLSYSGHVRDVFQLIKRGAIEQSPVPHPWQPFGPTVLEEKTAPGQARLTIVPIPAAPDATINFTLDGSAPAAGIAYTQPIVTAKAESVRAQSTWLGGDRISPESLFATRSPDMQPTLLLRARSGDADAWEDEVGDVDLAAESLALDTPGLAAWRFEEVALPAGAHVLGCRLYFVSATTTLSPTTISTSVELADNAAAFSANPGDLSSRQWSLPNTHLVSGSNAGRAGLSDRSPDLSSLVEEVIARPGWQVGNALAFNVSADSTRSFAAADAGLPTAAVFSVEYVETEALLPMLFEGIQFGSSITHLPNGAGGGEIVQMSFRRPLRFDEFGVTYTIETSPSLAADSWQIATVEEATTTLDIQPNWERVTVSITAPTTGPLFFRMRIAVAAE